MPAMSDVTVDPYHQNEADLSHVGPQPESAVWGDNSAQPETQSENFTATDFGSLNFDNLPALDCSTQNDCYYIGPVNGGPQCTTAADFSFQQDIKDPAAVPGCTGIRNLGNTCFMSSGLQCLVSNPSLITHFLEEFQPESDDVFFSSLTGQFALLLQKVWSGKYSVIYPAKFKVILGIYHPQFKDYRQHDCQEFLALLMDSLHEQLNRGSPLAKSYDSGEESSQSEQEEVWPRENNQLEAVTGDKLVRVASSQNDASSIGCQSEDSRLAEAILSQSLIVSDDSLQSEGSSVGGRSAKDEGILEDEKQALIPNNLTEVAQSSEDTMENNAVQGLGELVRTGFIENLPVQSSVIGESAEMTSDVAEASSADDCLPLVTSDDMEVDELKGDDEDGRKLPSLEDLYMKDTKTLNTNVLASDLIEEINMAVDSEKFHKVENTSQTSEMPSQFDLEHLNDLLTLDPAKGNGMKPIKETNLLAKVMDKFPDDGYPKKLLFSEIIEDENYSINNTKRFKIDDEEKNLKMQARMKVNTDKNPTKPVNTESNVVDVLECSAGVALPIRGRHHSAQAIPQTVQNLPPSGRYVRMADKAWQKHLAQNHSIIVDTFHGQFKSTVVCSECHHVSLTFEPFMYLSVPLPHAMERQISVIFVPSDNKQPIRYLITLNKQDSVKVLKNQVMMMIGEESCDMIIAEVLDNHIARILEDHTLLRYVNDSNRTIYAFEMLPAPDIDNQFSDAIGNQSNPNDAPADSDKTIKMQPNNATSSSGKSDAGLQKSVPAADVDSAVTDLVSASCSTGENGEDQNKLNNSMDHAFSQSWSSEDFRHNIDYQHNPLSGGNGSTGFDALNDNAHLANMTEASSTGGDREKDQTSVSQSEKSKEAGEEEEEGTNDGPTAADQWKTCAICLEEMIDSDLMAHASCGGTLCHSCLEMTFKHYGDAGLSCPVCSTPVDPAVDFIQLNDMADYKPKTRILSVPVVHRLDTMDGKDKVKSQLFGHPNMLYLPSNMTAEFLYGSVDRVVQCLANYVIILTDGQGLRCSRCLYTQHCSGCQLPREGEISLQPGDHLAIKFTDLNEDQMECTQKVIDHESMENLRPNEALSLFECFEAFTQSEVLDEHNPWYCPVCKHNRCANKTMTVWKYPNTLVVYLKRFVFHELSSTKIDSKVEFPLEDLDLSNFISGPTNDCLKYDLQSCVCHFGGVNSGHYTSYAKHPVSGDWIYYNDETVTHRQPCDEDYSNAYVLFYQRRGTAKNFKLPERLPSLPDLPDFPAPEDSTVFPSLSGSTDYISPPSVLITDCSSTNTQDKEMVPPGGAKQDSLNSSSNYDFYS